MIRHVRLIATGGTIATTTDPVTGRSAATLGEAVGSLTTVDGVQVAVDVVAGKPSWSLDPLEMAKIAGQAAEAASQTDVDGVVVTHGTTTLEYTAFLADLFVRGAAPVVFTGAMRRADDRTPDGPDNLRDAIAVAASPDARDHRALVVFASKILAGRSAWKSNRSDGDAFVDLSGAPVGHVHGGVVSIDVAPGPRMTFAPTIEPRVAFVKLVPGAAGELIDAALASDPLGLIVEALPGSGGVPPAAVPSVRRAAGGIPVVIASRAPFGTQPSVPTGGTGEPLVGIPLLSAGRLSAEAAWLLLMVILGQDVDQSRSKVRATFDAVASGPSAGAD